MKCELPCLHPNDYEKSLTQNEIDTDIFSFDIMKPTHLVEKVYSTSGSSPHLGSGHYSIKWETTYNKYKPIFPTYCFYGVICSKTNIVNNNSYYIKYISISDINKKPPHKKCNIKHANITLYIYKYIIFPILYFKFIYTTT